MFKVGKITNWIPFVLCIVLGLVAQLTNGSNSNGLQSKSIEVEHKNTSNSSNNVQQPTAVLAANQHTTWSAIFQTTGTLNMTMKERQVVPLTISHIDAAWGDNYELHVLAEKPHLVYIDFVLRAKDIPRATTSWSGNFTVDGLFLGSTKIYVELRRPHFDAERSQESLDVIVLRNMGILNTLFRLSIGFLVMVLYVNFGTALEFNSLKRIILRPIGPTIGFVGQFVIMPLLSFFIGYILFPDMIELRLGLFFTGSTPGGGTSNIFTVVLNGNLNLSVMMTALSNFAAFGMMPLWIFTLGALIFEEGNFAIPYATIAMLSFSLLLPLGVGIALQMYTPNLAVKLEKLLKPLSVALVVFITVFAFTVNSYIFKLFSWKILIAASALPWLGFVIGWALSILLRQSAQDAMTIAIETGIQNTAIAIFMLHFTLPQPEADITSAVPIASSMMTPLPLLAIYVFRKIYRRCRNSDHEMQQVPTKEPKLYEVEAMTKAQQQQQQS